MSSPSELRRPEPLGARHAVSGFDCGVPDLNSYLTRHALQNHRAGAAKTFVATADDLVVGYYSLAASQVVHAAAPERVRKGFAAHPVPVVLLARLAVDHRWQGKNLRLALLKDAILRVLAAAQGIGIRALLVHAKDAQAKAFYQRFGFEPLPDHPLHLMLLLKDAKRQIQAE